jgi:hypothetical protein
MKSISVSQLMVSMAFLLGIISVANATSLNANLIVNPGAEADTGAADFSSTVAPSGWITTSNFTAVQYAIGTPGDLQTSNSTAIGGGANYFAGGPSNASSSAHQDINISDLTALIDAGKLTATLSGYIGGFSDQDDNVTVTATFLNGSSAEISQFVIGPVTAADRTNVTNLLFRTGSVPVPGGTRTVRITMLATRLSGSYNDGYADNLSFSLQGSASVPTMTEWGMIIFVLLAGMGSVFYLRRQRIAER